MATKTVVELGVGDAAPEFDAQDDQGISHTLKQYRGKTVVLYFYPKDNTPGCTTEACGFRDSFAQYKKKGAVIFGVSPDSGKSHHNFKQKFELPFPLLVDQDKTLCQAYGVWKEKSMYGRKYMGVERSTFVVGPDGKIKAAWRKVSVAGHVDEVLQAI
ncbi:MAG: thioredoxin-dependent thiol peroxidase [Elusimicrobia bacterium]|nr:thioredoxin-dependent thiol peroxidase [Elusimicrobiota bacterium]